MSWVQKFKRTNSCSFVRELHGDGQTEASHDWEVLETEVLQERATSLNTCTTKALMTSVIFKESLSMKRRMKTEKSRILLIIVNCSCHDFMPFGACGGFILVPKHYLDSAAAGSWDNSLGKAALPSSCGPAYAVRYCLRERH